ncbi:hypothetical protein BLS_006665 [Venturia inaequalis]|uniref:Sodium bile acid symporter family protein n=1 Tax=Venturia inaequalis TaxID=5025 RepID=A0A8H3UAK9_VENIN|nr:hypothetical protein BLS_006665 [Venturia inaequalis]
MSSPSNGKSEDQNDRQISILESRPASPAPSSKYSNVQLDRPIQGGARRKFWPSTIKSVLWYFKDQWFLIALGVLIAIASQVQVPASQQELKTTVVTYLCVSIIFLMTGCLIFAGCIPTTISSNVVMTGQAHGNTALTVVQSTLGNFLGPFLTPVLISMYTSTGAWYTKVLPSDNGGYGEIYRRVFKQLGLSIFVPLVAGQTIQNAFPKQTKHVFTRFKLSKLGSFCLLVIIWQTYDQAFSSGAFQSIKPSNIIFIVFISIALFFIFLAVCFFTSTLWLPRQDTISVCYCVPAKTPAMGVPLANVMFIGLSAQLESKIQIPMVIYQGLQIVAGSLLTMAFRHWIRPEEEAKARVKLEEEGHDAATRLEPAHQLQEPTNAPAA